MPFRRVRFELPRWVIVIFVAAPFTMGALGAIAVTQGQDQAELNCEAVIGLRNDLVSTLEYIRDGASVRNPEQAAVIQKQYNFMIDRIGDPDCP